MQPEGQTYDSVRSQDFSLQDDVTLLLGHAQPSAVHQITMEVSYQSVAPARFVPLEEISVVTLYFRIQSLG